MSQNLQNIFLCCECSCIFLEPSLLINHIKYTHPYLTRYQCKQVNCFRNFKDLTGLRRHLLKNHFYDVGNKQLHFSFDTDSDTQVSKYDTTLYQEEVISENSIDLNNINNPLSVMKAFVSKLYANPGLNRALVQNVVDYSKELTEDIFSHLIENSRKFQDCSELKNFLNKSFETVMNNFQDIKTEYLRFKFLEKHKVYNKPLKFNFGNDMVLSNVSKPGEQPTGSITNTSGQITCISGMLKQFLELPDVLNTINKFIREEETNQPHILTSCFQGDLWRNLKNIHNNKKILPLYLYFDDFEPLNVLGSRAGNYKIGAVYISLACIPPEFSSQLENIFLGQLFYSADRNQFTNKNTFRNIINNLKLMEEKGIEIETSTGKITVHFVLMSILGDNLGLNSILGFSESFNSEYFCRLCITPKLTTQKEWRASCFVSRSKETYDLHCIEQTHGVKETAVWNELISFHVTENPSCDLMHDMLLGVLRYDLAFILNYLIRQNYFSLEHINERIKFFKFSKIDTGNVMPQIKQEHLRRNVIVISASEMLSLTLYLGVLVGDLIPNEDPVWRFYTLTVEMLDNLLARSFSAESIKYLQHLIEEHHELVIELFGEHLRPKYHFLLHYPKIIRLLGPPRYYWSMRYESFHRLLKCTANSVTCRKNLLVTLSIKQQLRFSSRILSKKGLVQSTCHGPARSLQNLIINYSDIFSESATQVNWITIDGFYYKKGLVLQITEDIFMARFAVIKYIILDKSDFFFISTPLETIGFSSHLQCYEVTPSAFNEVVYSYKNLENRFSYNIHYTADGKMVICTTK